MYSLFLPTNYFFCWQKRENILVLQTLSMQLHLQMFIIICQTCAFLHTFELLQNEAGIGTAVVEILQLSSFIKWV